jgi:hypothetical protein
LTRPAGGAQNGIFLIDLTMSWRIGGVGGSVRGAGVEALPRGDQGLRSGLHREEITAK